LAAKKITIGTKTGKTVYCIIKKESNGFLLDDSNGVFAAAPFDPYVSLIEHGLIKGMYSVSDGRSVWSDGSYTVTAYEQSGGSPVPSADKVLGINSLYVKNDEELTAVEEIATVNWDKLSSPVLVEQNQVGVLPVIRFNMVADRTIDLRFDLHSDVTGDTFYFSMKTDKSNQFYDVNPIECVVDDEVLGILSLTIPETDTMNLVSSKYYGELFRLTASGKYQTLVLFDIDLFPAIMSSRDA
jgi:hypothetical protein